MTYLNKAIVRDILLEMQSFESDLCSTFQKYGLDLRDNLGRRNALVSSSQERATANALRKVYLDVIEDGSPGKPDIFIKDIDTELECKLTSGSKTKSTSRSYSLQTDWETICKKQSLDYIFILVNDAFDSFCVLFFEGLTPDDYYPPAKGSRGKSRMKKKNAMKKCKALHGSFTTLNKKYINSYNKRINVLEDQCAYEIGVMINKCFDRSVIEAGNRIKSIEEHYDKKIKSLQEKVIKWQEADPKYSYVFSKLEEQPISASENSIL